MKIYVAEEGYDYEGFCILGIFTTKESAKKCCKEEKAKTNADYYRVKEYELKESTNG